MENPEKDGGPPDLGDSDSDTEEDVNVLFPRYKDLANGISWERRQKREARERLAEEARERLDESRRAQPIEAGTPAKAGSSADLPLAADEPGIASYNHEDAPGQGKGETHQAATVEIPDLLGTQGGAYTFKDVFGCALATTADGRTIDTAGLLMLTEKRGILNPVGTPTWEKLTLTVDSGASDTVVPPSVCPGAQLLTTGEKFGIEYEIADGSSIENLGEKHCLMKSQESDAGDASWEMKFQVVDVSKALLSVHRVCQQGHAVLFTDAPDGSAILVNGDSKNRIPIRHSGGTYELDVWVKPGQGFGRQR